MPKGYTYILSNKNKTVLYVGATRDLMKRVEDHKSKVGALFTKKYNAYILLYYEQFEDYRDAFRREKQLKNWHKEWKWNLIKIANPELKDLYLEL